jgi:queuine/archaeosine tRNA-ribosyltransferase
MTVDFDLPHWTGLVFEINEKEIDGYYLVKDIYSKQFQKNIAPDMMAKRDSYVLIQDNIDYLESMIERTRLMLEYYLNQEE